MGFAIGNLDKVCPTKRGEFNGYDIIGDWVADTKQKRGWIIRIVDGLEEGEFTIVDGEIHRSAVHAGERFDNRGEVFTEPEKAIISDSTTKAILKAVAQWESEDREIPCT